MYQLMIVDDEQFFRSNLKSMVDWERFDCRLVAEADNGHAAIEKLLQLDIDILITDMAMPYMDGVSLLEFVWQNCPATRCIVLSNFDSFDYVKKSMKLGAVDYIKPILRTNFLKSVLEGTLADNAQLKLWYTRFLPTLSTSNLIVVCFKIDNYYPAITSMEPSKQTMFCSTFVNLCQQTIEKVENGYIAHIKEDTFAFLFSSSQTNSSLYLMSRLNVCIENLHRIQQQFFNLTCSYGISDICNTPEKIPQFYQQALSHMKASFQLGKNSVIQWQKPKAESQDLITLDIEKEKSIYQNVISGDAKNTLAIISECFQTSLAANYSENNIQMLAIELINLSIRICKNKNLDISIIYDTAISPHKHLLQFSSLEDIEEYILSKFEKLASSFYMEDGTMSALTTRTICYLQANFTDPFLSLSSAATALGVNSSYLSRVMKSHLDVGFIEYLSTLRVKEACYLIRSSHEDIKSLAEKCGFSNYNYFFKVFKKYTGMTPQQYKENQSLLEGDFDYGSH